MSGQKAGNIKRLDVAVATPLRLVQMLKENRTLGAGADLGGGWARYWPSRCAVVPFPLSRCPVGGLRVPLAGPGLVGGSHGMAVREQLLLESLCMLCPCGIRSADR